MVRLFSRSFRSGDELAGDDREYTAKVVACKTGLNQQYADKGVNDVITRIKADADAARKATASLAFWITSWLPIAAFCASLRPLKEAAFVTALGNAATKPERTCNPILLWLLGIPIPLIILI